MMKPNQKADQTLWQTLIHFNAEWSEDQASVFSLGFEDLGYSLSLVRDEQANNQWLIRLLSETKPLETSIMARLALLETQLEVNSNASFVIETVPDIDWLAHVYQQFQPIVIPPFYIHGSHVNDKPDDMIAIEINAATAFGTGEHPTTKGCLQALSLLYEQGLVPERILDLGCGSGILAIAAARLWPKAHIIGTDMDAESIRVAGEYATINDVGSITHFETALGYDNHLIKEHQPFDLIFANILAGPLIDMARETSSHLATGGRVILSGMLREQQEDVQKAHENQALMLSHSFPIEEWTSLVMIK